MDIYKITQTRQFDAILELLARTYAREIINTELIIDVLNQNGVHRQTLVDEVNHNLISINNQIREQIYVEFGYLDPNALKKNEED